MGGIVGYGKAAMTLSIVWVEAMVVGRGEALVSSTEVRAS